MSEADAAIAAAGDGEPGAGIESAGVPATARAEVHDGDGVDAKGFAPLDGSGLDVSAEQQVSKQATAAAGNSLSADGGQNDANFLGVNLSGASAGAQSAAAQGTSEAEAEGE
jgi:hypothetical protein